MLLIHCPWCGPRDEEEFVCGGQAHLQRPEPAADCSDQEWADYLFTRHNYQGISQERWCHRFGCRQWFNLLRHTVSHEILAVYKMGQSAPELEAKI